MSVVGGVLVSIYSVLFTVELILMLFFRLKFKTSTKAESYLPKVTVLVCARNEEHNLRRCLDSILTLNYPQESMQVLVGDDNSEDGTWEIINHFQQKHTHIKGVKVENEKEGLIAKANVLNQLIDLSTDEFQVIIDADMEVQPNWLRTMVGALKESQLISGYTQIASVGRYSHLQFFDWQIVLHSMKAMADAIRPISILGNNMGFRKSAYDQVGGFRALGPTDVEDLGLLQRFQKAGLQTSQVIEQTGFAETQPQLTFSEMITQRCRWMNGVFTHHWILAVPAFFARLWVVPFLLTLFVAYFDLALFILSYAYFTTCLKYWQMHKHTNRKFKLFLYEPFFISLLDTFALLRIIFKGKVSWKGRKF